jgi:predicted GNAT family N-acyltransferase
MNRVCRRRSNGKPRMCNAIGLSRSHRIKVIGIVRLTYARRIGRMAVLPAWRRRGVGRALLAAALTKARELGFDQVIYLLKPTPSAFMPGMGFIAQGPEYLDAGIPHRSMSLELREAK